MITQMKVILGPVKKCTVCTNIDFTKFFIFKYSKNVLPNVDSKLILRDKVIPPTIHHPTVFVQDGRYLLSNFYEGVLRRLMQS
jgi:hypothetical protein